MYVPFHALKYFLCRYNADFLWIWVGYRNYLYRDERNPFRFLSRRLRPWTAHFWISWRLDRTKEGSFAMQYSDPSRLHWMVLSWQKWPSIIVHSHIHSGTFLSSTKSSSGEPFSVLEMEVSILFLLSWAARAQTRAKKSPLELLFTASTEWDGYTSLSVEWSIDDLSYDCLGSARDL